MKSDKTLEGVFFKQVNKRDKTSHKAMNKREAWEHKQASGKAFKMALINRGNFKLEGF